jgi:mono/diheme cytochrome c family protein
MKIRKLCQCAAAVIGILMCAAAQEKPRSVWDGVYTEEQARRGETVYGRECASCHLSEDSGGELATPLAGPAFLANWDGLTLGDLFERIRTTMPPNHPQRVTRQQNADVLGHILKINGYPAGRQELEPKTEVLKLIRIEASKPKDRSTE